MSVLPSDFLTWAKRLPRTTEMDLRCIVSRAYYGAYHLCLQQVQAMRLKLDGNLGTHARLIHALRNHRSGKLRALGRMLQIAKEMRVEADYLLDGDLKPEHADNAIEMAEQIRRHVASIAHR